LMFNPFLASLPSGSHSPKRFPFLQQTKRLTLRNLTVYYLDLLRCIVFKDRCRRFEPLFSRQR
ncbi:MAG: hypothetical protein ACI4O8_03540, partial [Aristaeellaceae bacterium]